MDKLKKVFSPGSKKDDEVLYGDADTRRTSVAASTSQREPEQLHAVEGSSKKERSILGQIINPGGDKYDDQRFGTTATTQEPVKESNKLYTDPEAPKDNSITRQILNPNNEKYDEQRFGETAATGGDRKDSIPATQAPPVAGSDVQLQTDPGKKDHSILRQVLNPHGDKYDEQGYGNTAHAAGDKDTHELRSDAVTNPDTSIKRQILNPGQEKYDPVVHGSSQPTAGAAATSTATPSQGVGSTEQTLPDRTATTTTTTTTTTTSAQPLNDRSAMPSQAPADETHYGRDAALVGGGAAATAGGVGYYAANRDNTDDKITDRPHPLSERAGDVTNSSTTAQGGYAGTATGPHAVGPAGGAHINPVGAPEESLTSGGSSHLERDAIVGAGAAGAAGAAASTQINSAPSDVQDATYTERAYPMSGGYHHTTGPHQTDIANILDPHVPGEFPAEEGTDKHGLNNPPLGPVVASDDPTTTSAATKSDNKTIVGTIASAVGLGGLVGGAASKDRSEQAVESTQSTSATTHPGGGSYPIQTTTNTIPSAPVAAQGTSGIDTDETGKSREHHYGRDAGIAAGTAGAGAAGYGVYEASRDRDVTDPTTATSGTVGQTSQQAAPVTTTTDTTSRTAVTGDPSTTKAADPEKGEQHYGRDAAIAGGAGAAGYGVYEATKDHGDTGPASKTIGPHESNVANVVDPRVQPDPEKQKESKTVGPHSSDLANKADPRVQSDPAKAQDNTFSRDAAIAGGAGAAGAGAVAATRYEDTTAGQTPSASNTATTTGEPPAVAAQKAREEEIQRVAAQAQTQQPQKHDPTTNTTTTSKKHEEPSHDDDKEKEKEKKPSLLHKILHPNERRNEKEDQEAAATATRQSTEQQQHPPPPGGSSLNHPLVTSEDIDNRISTDEKGHNKLHKKSVEQPHAQPLQQQPEGTVIEPHTGLPMDVGKYGTGEGGTDGAGQITGYRAEGSAGAEGVAGPDWEAVKKANTPY